jgi:hypothetical protein
LLLELAPFCVDFDRLVWAERALTALTGRAFELRKISASGVRRLGCRCDGGGDGGDRSMSAEAALRERRYTMSVQFNPRPRELLFTDQRNKKKTH